MPGRLCSFENRLAIYSTIRILFLETSKFWKELYSKHIAVLWENFSAWCGWPHFQLLLNIRFLHNAVWLQHNHFCTLLNEWFDSWCYFPRKTTQFCVMGDLIFMLCNNYAALVKTWCTLLLSDLTLWHFPSKCFVVPFLRALNEMCLAFPCLSDACC